MSGKPLDTAFRMLTAGIALALILWISQLPTDPSVAPTTIPLEVNGRQRPKSPRARITEIESLEQRRQEIVHDSRVETTGNETPPLPVNYTSRPAPVQIVSDRIETTEPAEAILPEISIPSPKAAPEVPTLTLGAPLPVAEGAQVAEPEPARIPVELQHELDQLKELRAEFKAVLDAKDADLDRLRRQNAELLKRLEEPEPPIEVAVPETIEVAVPETPEIAPERREPELVKPLPPPEPQLPVIAPAPTAASQKESQPKDPFGDSGAGLKEPSPAPAIELQPPAAAPEMPLPLPNGAMQSRPSPTMPFTNGRPVPRERCAPVENCDCHDCKDGAQVDCEECQEDGLGNRLRSRFRKKLRREACQQGDECDQCESRWGLLGKLCPYWCNSGYRQPEIFNMPAAATLLPPLDPHGEYHSTETPDWMKIAPTPSMDETPTPPPGGGTEPKY